MTSQAMKQNTKKIIDKKNFDNTEFNSISFISSSCIDIKSIILTTKNIFNVLRQTSVNAIIAAKSDICNTNRWNRLISRFNTCYKWCSLCKYVSIRNQHR